MKFDAEISSWLKGRCAKTLSACFFCRKNTYLEKYKNWYIKKISRFGAKGYKINSGSTDQMPRDV